MGRKRRKNSSKSRKPDRAQVVADLREAIGERRGRRAHALAKQLEKSGPPGEHAELLAKAYAVRAQEMLADGHCSEAAEMVDAFSARNADGAAHLDDCLSVNLDCFRDQPRLLRHWGDASWSDRLTAAISRGLLDLEWLRDAPGLPADHELRRQAGVLLRLWQTIEAGTAAEELEEWQVISRRSPLIHWRLFLQALGAYYAHDDATVEANLRRVPEESAVNPLAAGLRSLLREEAPAGEAGRAIWDRARGQGLEAELEHCQRLLDTGSKGAEPAVDALARKLEAAGRHQLAADIRALAYYRQGDADEKLAQVAYQAKLSSRDALLVGRLHSLEELEPDFFFMQIMASDLSLSPSEEAFLWLVLAKIQEENLVDMIATMHGPMDFDFAEEWESLEEYFLHSVECSPRPAIFNSWHQAAKRFEMDDAHILEKWREALPEDPGFLRAQGRSLYAQGRAGEARETLERLIEMEGSTPELQVERAWTILEEARLYLYQGELDKAEAMLTDVELHTAAQSVSRDILLWQAAGSDRAAKRARGQVLEAHEAPVMVLVNARIFDHELSLHQLPAGVKRQFDDPALVLKSFRSVCELPGGLSGSRAKAIDTPKVMEVFLDTTVDRGELLHTLEVLGRTSAMFADTFSFDIAQAITRNGLGRKREPRALFLAWHALLYIAEVDGLAPDPDQANLLLGAAAWLARQEKEGEEAVTDLATRLGQFPDPRERLKEYTRKQVNRLIESACSEPDIYAQRCTSFARGPLPVDFDASGPPAPNEDTDGLLLLLATMRELRNVMPPDEWDRHFDDMCRSTNMSKEQKRTLLTLLDSTDSPEFLAAGDPDHDFTEPQKLPFDDLWS